MPDDSGRAFSPPEPSQEADADDQEFVFRFRLDQPQQDGKGYDDPLLELVRGQLADLLDAVVLTHEGKRVMVDGFRLITEPEKNFEIFPKTSTSGPASPHAS